MCSKMSYEKQTLLFTGESNAISDFDVFSNRDLYSVITETDIDIRDYVTLDTAVIVLFDAFVDCFKHSLSHICAEIQDEVTNASIILVGEDISLQYYKEGFQIGIDEIIDGTSLVDTSLSETLETTILEYLSPNAVNLQSTTFSVAQSLMSAKDDELDTKIQWALQSLGESVGAIQCGIYALTSPENIEDDTIQNDVFVNQYMWDAFDSGIEEKLGEHVVSNCEQMSLIGQQYISPDDFPGYSTQLSTFEPALYNEYVTEDTPEFEADKASFLAIPIVVDWQLHSVFVIRTVVPQYWSDSVTTQFESIAELIVHVHRRKQQRVELKKKNERLEQFNSVVSHDLQNPLSVAKGYSQLALDTNDLSRVETVLDSIETMEQMINELLTLARQGKAIGETEPVKLLDVIAAAKSNVSISEGEIKTDSIPSEYTIECDKSRLQELFENLFRNGIDHVGDNVVITVTADDDTIIIGDDGHGIPESEREQIFDHGYTNSDDGTGFGLAIVERIVDAHGWDISVSESDAGGAAFVITL